MLPTSAGVEPATSWSPIGQDPCNNGKKKKIFLNMNLKYSKKVSDNILLMIRPGFIILNQSRNVPTEFGPPKMRDAQVLRYCQTSKNGEDGSVCNFFHSYRSNYSNAGGVVEFSEGVVYLTSLGRPTDIGLQLDKACCPCSR